MVVPIYAANELARRALCYSNGVPDPSTGMLSGRSHRVATVRRRAPRSAHDRQMRLELRLSGHKSPDDEFRSGVSASQVAEDTRFEQAP